MATCWSSVATTAKWIPALLRSPSNAFPTARRNDGEYCIGAIQVSTMKFRKILKFPTVELPGVVHYLEMRNGLLCSGYRDFGVGAAELNGQANIFV